MSGGNSFLGDLWRTDYKAAPDQSVFVQELGLLRDQILVERQFEARKDPEDYMKKRKKFATDGQDAAYEIFKKVYERLMKEAFPSGEAQQIAKRFADATYGAWVTEMEAVYPVSFLTTAIREEDNIHQARARAGRAYKSADL